MLTKLETVKSMDLGPDVAAEFVYKDSRLDTIRLHTPERIYDVTAKDYQGITVYAPAAPKMVKRWRAEVIEGEKVIASLGEYEYESEARTRLEDFSFARANQRVTEVEVPEPLDN